MLRNASVSDGVSVISKEFSLLVFQETMGCLLSSSFGSGKRILEGYLDLYMKAANIRLNQL